MLQLCHLQYFSHGAGTIAKINQSKTLIFLKNSWVFAPSHAHTTARLRAPHSGWAGCCQPWRSASAGCSGRMKKQKFLSWHSANEGSLGSRWPGQVRQGRGCSPVPWGCRRYHRAHTTTLQPLHKPCLHMCVHTQHTHTCMHTCVCSPQERVLCSQGHTLHMHVHIARTHVHVRSVMELMI